MLAFVSAPAGSAPAGVGAHVGSPSSVQPPASAASLPEDSKLAVGVAAVVAGLTITARRNRRKAVDAATPRHFDEKDIESADVLAAIRNTKGFREADRETRRPVFGYQDWKRHRSEDRDLTRQSLARIDGKKHPTEKESMVKLTAAFPRILHYHLSEQTPEETQVLTERLDKLLPPAQAKKIMSATHKPMTLCGLMSKTLENSGLELFDKLKFDKILTDFADYYGMCERIFKTPIPLAYTRLTARFLTVWLVFLPFALYSQVSPHWAIIPITALISLFIFGIEELGVMIEEPFSVLPLEKIGDGIQASMFEALELYKIRAAEEK